MTNEEFRSALDRLGASKQLAARALRVSLLHVRALAQFDGERRSEARREVIERLEAAIAEAGGIDALRRQHPSDLAQQEEG